MSVNSLNTFLNVKDAHLRVVSGNVYATGMNIGGINVDVAHGLQSVTNQGNVTSNTIQFSNVTTGIVTTANITVGRDLTVTGNVEASNFIGDGSQLTGLASNLEQIVNNGNVTSNTVQFTNATTGFVTTANVEVGGELTMTGTGALTVPSGTTAERPGDVEGMFRYNTDTGYMEAYTATGWGALATPPSIVSVSPTSVAFADTATQVFTVSGASFVSGLTINLVGADGTNYDVVDRTFVNATSATFKMGDLSSATAQVANRPYKVKVTGGSGLTATSTQTINFPGTSWTSPAAAATLTFSTATSVSHTLVGTDAVGGTSGRTFAVAPGSNPLPSPLSLNASTGLISGTIGAINSGTNVTFRVVDVSGVFVERTFNIVGIAGIYAFSGSHTFTPAGVTGYAGPTLVQLRDAYSPTWADNSSYLNVTTQGYQLWTVPETGSYTVEAIGANGGDQDDGGGTGGKGARIKGTISLTVSTVLKILVGQKGTWAQRGGSGRSGGGGGTFVVFQSNNYPITVAGGGGGWGGSNGNGKDASSGTIGVSGSGGSSGSNLSGGSGSANTSTSNGGWGSTGSGFYSSSGSDPNMYNGHSSTYYESSGFLATGLGAYGDPGPSPNGGFGGGGGGAANGGGGGGGWSGGGNAGGSGGSVNYTSSGQVNTSGYNTSASGHGSVIITKI